MGNRLARWAVFILALAVAVPTVSLAQSDAATGSISGMVTDQDGSALPGVTVTCTNSETGFSRSRQTDATGRYALRLLPPGTYTLIAALDGFGRFEQQGVRAQVGSQVNLPIQLGLESVTEEIIVTSEAPVLETTKASLTSTVSDEELQSLPLNGRDFTDLVALTPQAVDIDSGRVSVNGQRGIMNSFNIDGADSNSSFFGEERGGTRPAFTYSAAAIKEFQVVRSSYSARFGNASGGIINAVTKTGTNDLHGEVFYFNQSDSFIESKDALGNPISTFDRDQAGFNLGGPVVRDKFHYFFAYDSQRSETAFPRNPDFQDDLDEDPALNAAWNQALIDLGIDPTTEFDYNSTNDQDVFLIRFDWAASDNHQVWLRSNWSTNEGENLTDTTFNTTGRSSNGFEENSFNTTVASLNSVIGNSSFNELNVQFSAEERPRAANTSGIPEINIDFFDAVIGQNQFLPNFLDEDKLEIQDNFSTFAGDKHTIKAGFNYTNVEFDDGFCRYCSGSYETIFLRRFRRGEGLLSDRLHASLLGVGGRRQVRHRFPVDLRRRRVPAQRLADAAVRSALREPGQPDTQGVESSRAADGADSRFRRHRTPGWFLLGDRRRLTAARRRRHVLRSDPVAAGGQRAVDQRRDGDSHRARSLRPGLSDLSGDHH